MSIFSRRNNEQIYLCKIVQYIYLHKYSDAVII
nr:MAG TPA: hypothetical protein [Caudoviricetes sp.]